ncbi:MAG: hypothetical protein ACXVCY_13225 [Pseudobdellovibrionaceae bacterium]
MQIRTSIFYILFSFLAVLFAANAGFAENPSAEEAPAAETKPEEANVPESKLSETPSEVPPEQSSVEEYIEETRHILSKRVLRLADSVDSLFGDKRADDLRNKSTLRVSQRYFTKDGVTGGENLQATLNLYLPNLKKIENRLSKKISETLEKENNVGGPGTTLEKEENPWSLSQEHGVVVAVPVDYFFRFRLRHDFLARKFVNPFYIQVGWSKSNEWQEVNSLTSDYAITRDLLFRFVNEIDWGMTSNSLGSIHGPSLIRQISPTDGISFDLRLNNALEGHDFDSYRASVGSTYRRLLPNGWIFLELNPELAWERSSHFKPLYNFYLKVELVFGNI